MSTTAQVQPDWFDANGQAITPQSAAQTAPTSGDDWFAQNSPSSPDYQSQTRMMALSGLTGMPTPNMNDADRQSYGRGKATGYLSGIAAGALGGAAASPAADAAIYETAKAYGYGSELVKDALASPLGKYVLKRAIDLGVGAAGFHLLYGAMKKAGAFSK